MWIRPRLLIPVSPPPPALRNHFSASEMSQTCSQGPQAFCLPHFREDSLFTMHRLSLSLSVTSSDMTSNLYLNLQIGEALEYRSWGWKAYYIFFPSTSETSKIDIKVYAGPNLECRILKEKKQNSLQSESLRRHTLLWTLKGKWKKLWCQRAPVEKDLLFWEKTYTM